MPSTLQDHDKKSPAHGAVNWTDADPSVFPSGLRAMYKATGWPVVAHARAWASRGAGNVYAKANPAQWIESVDQSGEVIGSVDRSCVPACALCLRVPAGARVRACVRAWFVPMRRIHEGICWLMIDATPHHATPRAAPHAHPWCRLPIAESFWDTLFANANEWGCLQYLKGSGKIYTACGSYS